MGTFILGAYSLIGIVSMFLLAFMHFDVVSVIVSYALFFPTVIALFFLWRVKFVYEGYEFKSRVLYVFSLIMQVTVLLLFITVVTMSVLLAVEFNQVLAQVCGTLFGLMVVFGLVPNVCLQLDMDGGLDI